jgi:hypothetical protein
MASAPHKWVFGVSLLVCFATPITGRPPGDPADKVTEFALDSLLKRGDWPPESGVELKVTKAEWVERDAKKVLRVHWSVRYSGKRWPLVILAPSLDRETDGQTRLTFLARGKSGDGYGWTAYSPRPIQADIFLTHSQLD